MGLPPGWCSRGVAARAPGRAGGLARCAVSLAGRSIWPRMPPGRRGPWRPGRAQRPGRRPRRPVRRGNRRAERDGGSRLPRRWPRTFRRAPGVETFPADPPPVPRSGQRCGAGRGRSGFPGRRSAGTGAGRGPAAAAWRPVPAHATAGTCHRARPGPGGAAGRAGRPGPRQAAPAPRSHPTTYILFKLDVAGRQAGKACGPQPGKVPRPPQAQDVPSCPSTRYRCSLVDGSLVLDAPKPGNGRGRRSAGNSTALPAADCAECVTSPARCWVSPWKQPGWWGPGRQTAHDDSRDAPMAQMRVVIFLCGDDDGKLDQPEKKVQRAR
jgi:hypothetical protein